MVRIPRHTIISTEILIIQKRSGAVIAVRGFRIQDILAIRIEAFDRVSSIFMTPDSVRILTQYVIILARMHCNRDLAHLRRALPTKGGSLNGHIHIHESFDDLAVAIFLLVQQFRHLSCGARLMEVGTAARVALALLHLIRIDHIHRIGETVVSALHCFVAVIAFGIELWFPT